MTFTEIIRKHFGSYIESEKVVSLLDFMKHKKDPERALLACLMYKRTAGKHKREAMERQFGYARSRTFELCKECEELKI